MNTLLKILIQQDEIDISSPHNFLNDSIPDDNHYININIIYDNLYLIQSIKCNYSLFPNIVGNFSVNDIDIDIPTEIGFGPDDIEKIYNNEVINKSELYSHIDNLPGNNHLMKFSGYFIGGIGIILTFFELIKIKGLFDPLEIAFPEIDSNINILNKKYYNYFNYYIKTLDSSEMLNDKIIKNLLEYITDYFEIFNSLFEQNNDNKLQDMYCIHASTLGYGIYLEKRLQTFISKIGETENIKKKEVSKYYDEEILKIAERVDNLKNEMNLTKEYFSTSTKRSKDELDIYTNNIKLKINQDIKKTSFDVVNKGVNDIKSEYNSLFQKGISELDRNINVLTSTSISKIKNELSQVLDQKVGVLSELSKYKIYSIDELEKKGNSQVEIIMNTSKNEYDKLSQIGNGYANLFKKEMDTIIKDAEFNIIKSIKTQSSKILNDMIDDILENFGEALEEQINKKINKKFKELNE